MRGHTNTTGVKESTGFPLPSEGDYELKIIEIGETITENGDPMAKLVLEITSGKYEHCLIWDNIVIPGEGSPAIKILGRTKHFWHCIGEPYEGNVAWNTERWLHKKVMASLKHEIQKGGKNAGRLRAVIDSYILPENDLPGEAGEDTLKEESMPNL